MDPYHQIQFSVITKIPFFGEESNLLEKNTEYFQSCCWKFSYMNGPRIQKNNEIKDIFNL